MTRTAVPATSSRPNFPSCTGGIETMAWRWMVGRGDVEENRRKAQSQGLEFPVVLQQKWELSRKYGIFATPVAFLVGEDGVIKRDVALGPDAILAMANHAVGQERTL